MFALQIAFGEVTPQRSQAEHVGVFSKLGGAFLGWLVKPRLDLDLAGILRDMQRQVGCFFKHPCRSFRHIVLFAGSVQIVPAEFVYRNDLSRTKTDKLHSALCKATRIEASWNHDDSPACHSIIESWLDIRVVKSELRVRMVPSQPYNHNVLLLPALDVVNSNDVMCVQTGWRLSVQLACLPSPRPIKNIMLFHRATTLGDMECFLQAETLAIRRPGGLAKLDDKALVSLSKSSVTTLELVLWSCLPNQIGLMTKLTSLNVVHEDQNYPYSYSNGYYGFDNGYYGFDTIPSELGLLTNLTTLTLSGPGFQGNVPSQLGNLLNLKELAIIETWTTRLPTELGALASLQRLDLSGNQKLSTKLPSQLDNLDKLEWIDLSLSLGVQNYDVMTRGRWHVVKKNTWCI